MARLRFRHASAFLLQAFLTLGVSSASSNERSGAPFLARSRMQEPQLGKLVALQSAAPAPAAPLAPAAAPPPTFSLAAPAPAMAPAFALPDCTGVCEQAKKMWTQAAETQQLAIDLEKNRTAARIKAEADMIVEDLTLKVHTQGLNDLKALQAGVDSYRDGRVQAFSAAIANRHNQVVAAKAAQFAVLKAHQGNLMHALTKDVETHGYEVAKASVQHEATAAGINFNNNPKIHQALESVAKAGQKWALTYHTTEEAARLGFDAWSGAYHSLDGPWNNVTGTFESANRAARAARGLGPDTRWANEIVRVSGDVTQAAQTEAMREASQADLALSMAEKSEKVVSGNSGSIVILSDMLDHAEGLANAASIAR